MRKQKGAPPAPKIAESDSDDGLVAQAAKPLVFISHDSRDAKLAEAFSDLLTAVSAGVLKSFRSSDKKGGAGIEYGSEWYTRIMTALHDSTDVVALLTPHSVGRPWILFEAGVAKGRRNSVVFGVALGVPLKDALTGPFSQFQNCGDDEDELTKLVMQLIKRVPNADPDEGAIRRQVKVFLDAVNGILKQPARPGGNEGVDETTVAKLFEEVKVLFRDLPQQVETKLREMGSNGRRFRRRKFHPMMLEDALRGHGSFERDEKRPDTLSWLLLVSMFREDAPWFYELGMEVYRGLRGHDAKKLAEATHEFHRMARMMNGGHPMFIEFFADGEDGFMATRHLPMMADEFLHRMTRHQPDNGESEEAKAHVVQAAASSEPRLHASVTSASPPTSPAPRLAKKKPR
jgi:hypothetical protein